jgi:hypothetical protein
VSTRPRAVTLIGWLFIAVGGAGIARGLWDVVRAAATGPSQLEAALLDLGIMIASGIVAVLGGALLLRGSAWGRWLLLLWMAFHIVISALDDRVKLAMHVVLFGAVLYFLLGAETSAYLRRPRPGTE